jgi:tetratricopeptide (TPR) repeat protein
MTGEIFSSAEKLREGSRYSEALGLYKMALARFRKSGDYEGMLNSLLAIGDSYRMVGDFLRAQKAYSEAASLSLNLRGRITRADAMVGKGLSMRALGEWKKALVLFSGARRIYLGKSDKFGVAFTFWADGGAFRVKGDLGNAIGSFRKAKKMYESLLLPKKRIRDRDNETYSCAQSDARRGLGYCLCGLGGVSRVSGMFDDSARYYAEANELFTSIKDKFGIAYSHCGIGNALRMKSDYDGGMKHLRRAESVYRTIGDIVSYSYTLWSMGMIYVMKRKLSAAGVCFEKAASHFRNTRDVRGLVYCGLGLSELDFLRGDRSSSRRRVKAALRDSLKKGFALEACHSRTLLNYLETEETDNKCYNRLGARLRFGNFPFNIP